MTLRRLLGLTSLLALCFATTTAQDFPPDGWTMRLDSFTRLLEAEEQGMGSLCLMQDGRTVYQRAWGTRAITDTGSLSANAQTLYRVGSISKTYTATIVMQLVGEGRLSLQTPLSTFFEGLPNGEKITIDHLLNHSSGLFNFTNDTTFWDRSQQAIDRSQLVREITDYAPTFAPGSQNMYSNTNYVLLALIAEQLTEQPLAQLIESRILRPQGLTHTLQGGVIDPRQNQALSYEKRTGWQPSTVTHMSWTLGAGSIQASASDVSAFLHGLHTGLYLDSVALRHMQSIHNGYGRGLFRFPFFERKAYGHTGGIDGFQSMAAHFPAEGVTIAYLSNGVVYPLNDVMKGALSIYFGEAWQMPQFKKGIQVDNLAQYVGQYVLQGIPMTLDVRLEDGVLVVQPTAQPTIALTATDTHTFVYDAAGLKLIFEPENQKVILHQNGIMLHGVKQ